MTTRQPASAGFAWRQRWAEKENDARLRAHAAAFQEWRYRDDDLRWMRRVAAGFPGLAQPGAASPVELASGEIALCVLPDVCVVGTGVAAQLPAPDPTRLPAPMAGAPAGPPPSITPMDVGTALVTDRRVVLRGAEGEHEWRYDELDGLAHDASAPFTLFRVAGRDDVSGLLLSDADVAIFRFHLTVAIAHAAGERLALVAHLDGLLAAHASRTPTPPRPVVAAQAPVTAVLSRGKWALVAGTAVVVAAMLVVVGIFQSPRGSGPFLSAAVTAGPTPGQIAVQAVPSAAEESPLATVRTTGPAGLATPTPILTRSATRSPTASPKAAAAGVRENLCGAPANPYGYTFCGGAPVTEPEPDVCSYFTCVDRFDRGTGYLVQCGDGTFGWSEGRWGTCWQHGGDRRPVYR